MENGIKKWKLYFIKKLRTWEFVNNIDGCGGGREHNGSTVRRWSLKAGLSLLTEAIEMSVGDYYKDNIETIKDTDIKRVFGH